MSNNTEILKVLVGSRAHGLDTVNSDSDFKVVYVSPTTELLKLGDRKYNPTSWIEGIDTEQSNKIDQTAWEVGHFLHMATKSNPTILEVFNAPIILPKNTNNINYVWGDKLRKLFPYVWSSTGVYNAFRGYAHNQHKKIFDEKEESVNRKFKYAVAHIRVLLQGIELLTHETLTVKTSDIFYDDGINLPIPSWAAVSLINLKFNNPHLCFPRSWKAYLMAIKQNRIQIGNIIDTGEYLKNAMRIAYEKNSTKKTNLVPINEFLLAIRKEFWE